VNVERLPARRFYVSESEPDNLSSYDHFNNIPNPTELIPGLDPDKTEISVISRAEILVGLEDKIIGMARSLLGRYTLLIIHEDIADRAAELRKMYGWKLPDAFQAAMAIYNHIKLSTRDTKNFDPSNIPLLKFLTNTHDLSATTKDESS